MSLPESLRSPVIRWIGIAPINAEVVPGHGAILDPLRRKKRLLQGRIAKHRREIKSLTDDIKAVDAEIRATGWRKRRVEQEASTRAKNWKPIPFAGAER